MGRKSKFSEAQIIAAIREVEGGATVGEVARKVGVSLQTLARWRERYSGMTVNEAKDKKRLEEENARLKKLVAQFAMEIDSHHRAHARVRRELRPVGAVLARADKPSARREAGLRVAAPAVERDVHDDDGLSDERLHPLAAVAPHRRPEARRDDEQVRRPLAELSRRALERVLQHARVVAGPRVPGRPLDGGRLHLDDERVGRRPDGELQLLPATPAAVARRHGVVEHPREQPAREALGERATEVALLHAA